MDNYWITNPTSNEKSADLLGGKGLNLFRLKEFKTPVPEFGVVSTEAFLSWKKNGKLPSKVLESIKNSISKWETSYVAVRSSTTAEDGSEASFAGMMESYLFVTLNDLEETIYKCFKSHETDRVKAYQKSRKLNHEQRSAVVIQKMVNSTESGVAFSRSPVQDSSLALIEAGYGLGEGVVSGRVEVDQYYVDRFFNEVYRKVNEKTLEIVLASEKNENNEFIEEKKFSSAKGNQPVLKEKEIQEISKTLFMLESATGGPCDIEWAFEGDKLYFLQVRPITQKFKDLKYFIDTNLTESYPGVTCQLTSDFVKLAYEKTFTEAAEVIGFSSKRMKGISGFLNKLLSSIEGHMYYNLESYYAILKTFPGGEKNIENWHRMIGGEPISQVLKTSELKLVRELSKMELLWSGLNVLKLFLFHGRIYGKFRRDFWGQLKSFELKINKSESANEILKNIEKSMSEIKGFGLTVLNDFLIMLSLKGVTKVLSKYNLGEEYLPSLIKTTGKVESLKPLEALNKLVVLLKQHPQALIILKECIESTKDDSRKTYPLFYKRMDSFGLNEVSRVFENYLKTYGERSFEELKLESLSFKQAPELFNQLLEWKVNSKSDPTDQYQASSNLSLNMSSFKLKDKIMMKLFLNYAHKTIAMREETRLLRGYTYGYFRTSFLKAFYAMKEEFPETFKKNNVMSFFSLDLKTLFSNLDSSQLQRKINENWKDGHDDYPEHLAFSLDSKPWFTNESFSTIEQVSTDTEFFGLGASPGKIEGEPLVLFSPQEALNVADLSNKILITKTTDPAWVFIMSQCKGLISEKGSLLSHTAIIGREMGIPTVVGLKNATHYFKTVKKIELDGKKGKISILS